MTDKPSALGIIEEQALTPIDKATKLVKLKQLKKVVDQEISNYQDDLLVSMKENGVDQLKTDQMTISRVTRPTTVKVQDFNAARKSLDDKNIPYTVVEAFGPEMDGVFREMAKAQIKESGLNSDESRHTVEVENGLEVNIAEYVMVRVKNN